MDRLLFTQTIIDKVIVNRTSSTLITLIVGMAFVALFSSILNWIRQYLVLHTGNRVDAALGATVFERLFKLPTVYFQHRPTGVINARLQGIESIREFLANAAVTLVLDIPFILIFLAIMFYYSVSLSLVVVGFLIVITGLSLIVAPAFQRRLQEQFLVGAKNQAFVTEFVSAVDTVKVLQLEPQVAKSYRKLFAAYLAATFKTRQLSNSYSSVAQFFEQLQTLIVLGLGAWLVMQNKELTIGMLVAFQMFSGRVSQPVMRLVGLWQQFQQAKLAVDRLGDLMNAPIELYSNAARRTKSGKANIVLDNVSFRYGPDTPVLFSGLTGQIEAGSTVAIMGSSGCGKSTLTRLMLGYYRTTDGRIQVDGIDVNYFSANELRSYFGVVPQETILFSGSILENLTLVNPEATFEMVVAACKLAEIHEVIESLAQGYETVVGERGVGLSGGQKQRIAIARALLKRPQILIFDEATSALDSTTAEDFARTINSLRGRVTMIFVAHAIPKSLDVDQILQLTRSGISVVASTANKTSVAT